MSHKYDHTYMLPSQYRGHCLHGYHRVILQTYLQLVYGWVTVSHNILTYHMTKINHPSFTINLGEAESRIIRFCIDLIAYSCPGIQKFKNGNLHDRSPYPVNVTMIYNTQVYVDKNNKMPYYPFHSLIFPCVMYWPWFCPLYEIPNEMYNCSHAHTINIRVLSLSSTKHSAWDKSIQRIALRY